MVTVLHAANPLLYFQQRAPGLTFVKVLAFSRSVADIRRFLGSSKAAWQKLEVGTQKLVPGEPIDVILKILSYDEISKGRYSLTACSSYEVMWIFETDLRELEATLEELLPMLPIHMPKLFVLTESRDAPDQSYHFGELCLYEHLVFAPNKQELSEKDRRDLFEKTAALIRHPELGLATSFVEKYRVRSNKVYLGLGVGLVAVAAIVFAFRQKLFASPPSTNN